MDYILLVTIFTFKIIYIIINKKSIKKINKWSIITTTNIKNILTINT
jgi:hypothetical protein